MKLIQNLQQRAISLQRGIEIFSDDEGKWEREKEKIEGVRPVSFH